MGHSPGTATQWTLGAVYFTGDGVSRQRDVAVVHQRVEEHAVLAEILPAPDGISGEQDNFTFASGHNGDGGAALDVVGAVEKAAEHRFFAAGEAHEHIVLVHLFGHPQQRPVGVTNGDGFCRVAIEDRIFGMEDVRINHRTRSVEFRAGIAGFDGWRQAEVRRKCAGCAESDQRPAAVDKLLEFRHADAAHAAGDVGG